MRVVQRGNLAALERSLVLAAPYEPTWRGDPNSDHHAGFHTEIYRAELGRGAFDAAVETVMTWGVPRGSAMVVHSASARVAVGVDVVVGLPIGPALVLAPCRVSDVWDSADRGGF